MIIDAHNHIGWEDSGQNQTEEQLMQLLQEANIDRAVAFPFGPSNQNYKKINEQFAQFLKNKKLITFGRVNHVSEDAVAEVERIHSFGFKGIKIHTRHAPLTDAPDVLRAIDKTDLPIIVHTGHHGNEHVNQFNNISFSGRIILGHGGKSNVREAAELLRKNENFFAETSILSAYGTQLLVENAPIEQVFMGSDSPFNHPQSELLKLSHLQARGVLTAEESALIAGKNFARSFKDTL